MRFLIIYLIVAMALPVWAQPTPKPPVAKPGDVAKNMKVLPPWTLRLCPKELHAAYGKESAKQLKKMDSACALWKFKVDRLEAQTKDFTSAVSNLKAITKTYQDERKLDQKRIQDLLKQVKLEIAEKNKYKYKPNYQWLYISIGAAIAIAGIAFGTGVWVAKKE